MNTPNLTRPLLILLAIATLTLVGDAQTIDAELTGGRVQFAAPVDPAIESLKSENAKLTARVAKLEAEVAELKKQFAAMLKLEVAVGEIKPLGSLLNK